MNIGKREQIVIGSVSAVALIAALHFAIFAPSAASFKQSKAARDQMAATIKGLRTIRDDKIITQYNQKTSSYLDRLAKGITQLQLDQPPEFVFPKLEEMQVETVAGRLPDDVKKDKRAEMAKQKLPAQMKLIMDEIHKLRLLLAERSVKLSFLNGNLASSWGVPEALPPAMQGGRLWDQIKQIADTKMSLDKMNPQIPSYRMMLYQYKQTLLPLGLNKDFSDSLARWGQFVPLIQRMCYADLINDFLVRSPTPVMILGEPLTRERLLNFFSVDVSPDLIPELDDGKPYFLYQDLKYLNYMLTVARDMKVQDVTAVWLRGYAFLRQQDQPEPPPEGSLIASDLTKLPDDEADDPVVWMTAQELAAMKGTAGANAIDPVTGMPLDPALGGNNNDPNNPTNNPAAAGAAGGAAVDPVTGMPVTGTALTGVNAGPPPSKPKDEDLGYAIPIKMAFIASNANGYSYIYEVMKRKPLAEFHRLVLRSTSTYIPGMTLNQANPQSTDIEMTATFLFVPKLFKALDLARQVINEIQGTSGTQPGSPQALAPPAAPVPPAR